LGRANLGVGIGEEIGGAVAGTTLGGLFGRRKSGLPRPETQAIGGGTPAGGAVGWASGKGGNRLGSQ